MAEKHKLASVPADGEWGEIFFESNPNPQSLGAALESFFFARQGALEGHRGFAVGQRNFNRFSSLCPMAADRSHCTAYAIMQQTPD